MIDGRRSDGSPNRNRLPLQINTTSILDNISYKTMLGSTYNRFWGRQGCVYRCLYLVWVLIKVIIADSKVNKNIKYIIIMHKDAICNYK